MADALDYGLIWLAVASLFGFFAMAFDKAMAIRRKARVPERTLLAIAALGGSPGVAVAMFGLRHKTRKREFFLRFWAIVAVQVAALLAFFFVA